MEGLHISMKNSDILQKKNEKLARFQHQTCCESWLKLPLDGENAWKNISFKKPGVAGVG